MPRAPLLFVSHGAPSVALEQSDYTRALTAFGKGLRPAAAVVVSAHWEERRPVRVGAAARHRTLHDFAGFADALYEIQYPAPGDPPLAAEIVRRLEAEGLAASPDPVRPLDHGVWVPLRLLFPDARVPVVPVALPRPRSPEEVARIGSALAALRDRGVLLVGSGGAVHNLSRISFERRQAEPETWAREFDAWLAGRLAARDLDALLAWRQRAPHAPTAHPTTEHLDPVFFVAGAAGEADRAQTLHEGFDYGNLSMRTVALG
ncbi:MAG: dioxygenase [Acidobacteriota bacterium]